MAAPCVSRSLARIFHRWLAVSFIFLMASSSRSMKALSKVYSKRLLRTCLALVFQSPFRYRGYDNGKPKALKRDI
jgi:hypothetical protein